MDKANNRVLSIQSHVVSGYVGNKSATFPLQVLGFEVDGINSVQFSNHTGYGHWKGQVLSKDELAALVSGLSYNGLDKYTHLLTGYVGDPTFLKQVAQVVKQLRSENPGLVYVCDPVMGDNGKMYVPEELLPIYRTEIIPLANIVTPNQYELELLVERPINSLSDALAAINTLHQLGIQTVVLSSSELGENGNLLAVASNKIGEIQKGYKIEIPRLPATFTGTGDLFAALFLAWMAKTNDLQETLEGTVATLQAVLKRTYLLARKGTEGDNVTVASLELKLIQSKADIEQPARTIVAEPLEL